MKIYFAQVMDNRAYLEHSIKLLNEFEKNNWEVYYPYRDEGIILEDEASLEQSLATFNADVKALKECDCLVGYIDGLGPDSGTCLEIGIAYALNKPIFLYTTEFKYLPKNTNLMELLKPYKDKVKMVGNNYITSSEPMINNMLIGASNNKIYHTIDSLIKVIKELNIK